MTTTDRWESLAYRELRSLASSMIRQERRNHTLRPTELVHEAWLRLKDQEGTSGLPRVEFLKLAATVMRHVLTDHARRVGAQKRGGRQHRVQLSEVADSIAEPDYLTLVNDALGKLAGTDAELSRLVELRFFAGCTTEELAEVLNLSPRTVKRRWRFARAWLHRAIMEDAS
jgi:RNA polymerase sigma factor (TIGR02999 family)